MSALTTWALRWRVSPAALTELQDLLSPPLPVPTPAAEGSEAAVSAAVRAEASRLGVILFRNNVGAALHLETGRPVRYGLANDSAALNARFKSSDLIGITREGRFVSFECKRAGWRLSESAREAAQERWLQFVRARGGIAAFVSDPKQISSLIS